MISAACFISNPAQIPAGSGTVTFAGRTVGEYKARIAIRIPFEKVVRSDPRCTFAVILRCCPFFCAGAAADNTVTASGTVITNRGSVCAGPILTVTGSGDITRMAGTNIAEPEGISGNIVPDCAPKEACLDSTPMNDHMTGAFPVLKPGMNSVSRTGTVTGWL